MSQENVELVVKLLPRAGQNLVPLFRDDDAWAAFTEAVAPFFHRDFETLAGGLPDGETTYIGLDGFRAAWRDWTGLWATYRTEIDDALGIADFAVLVGRIHFRGKGSGVESTSPAGWMLKFRDGRLLRFRAFREPAQALEAGTAPTDTMRPERRKRAEHSSNHDP